LPVINFHAAGIYVGITLTITGYTNIAGEPCVCRSGCFTKDLKELVGLLVREGVSDAAMEATGV
jgi:hypothetical protein